MIIQGLLTVGGVHDGPRHIRKGRALVGHGVLDDGIIVNSHRDGLADFLHLQHRDLHVVPGGGHGGADAVGSLVHVGSDRQAVVFPQFLDVGNELLVAVNLAGLEGYQGSVVVGVDAVSDVLRHRQLAPHGGILSPISVVADEGNDLIVGEVGAVGAGIRHVGGGISQHLGGVIAVVGSQLLEPGLLGNIGAGQEVLDDQGVHRLTVFRQLGLDHDFAVHRRDGVDVSGIAGIDAVLGLNSRIPGRLNIFSGHRGTVGPLGSSFNSDSHFGQVIVPRRITIGQQGIQAAVQHVVHIQGLEHHRTGAAGCRGVRHGVVHVGADGVPADDGAPLLTAEVDGLFTGQVLRFFGAGKRCHAQHESESQNQGQEFLHLGFPP